MAAITSYTTLRTAMSDWSWTTAYDSFRNDFIQSAHAVILYGKGNNASDPFFTEPLRHRSMETQIDLILRAAIAITAANVGGTANAITLTTGTSIAALLLGHRFTFTATATNTGAVTVAVDGLAATDLQDFTEDGIGALAANRIVDDAAYEIMYDGTRFLLCPRGGYPLPSRFLEFRRLYIDSDPVQPVDFMPPKDFWFRYTSSRTGAPKAVTIEGDYIIHGPRTDAFRVLKAYYYRAFATLSGDSDTNWLIDNMPNTYLFGAMMEMAIFAGDDDRAKTFHRLFSGLLGGLNRQNKRDRYSGAALVARSSVPVY